MNGFLIVDKPLGRTSSDMVLYVRKRLPRKTPVGHGGTLDPEASGVLPVCVGAATRLFDYIIDKQKTYVAELQLGVVTDTQDATGRIISESPVRCGMEELRAALPRFIGNIEQIPPMYSAVKRDGQRLYALARRGETVELAPRPCRVDGIEIMERTGEHRYRLRIRCGKGVYIRTICHDIGAALGCGGHMASLRRTQAGVFAEENALSPEEIDRLFREGHLADALIPMDAPLAHLSRVDVSGERAARAVKNGNILKAEWLSRPVSPAEAAIRIYLDGIFVGMGAADSEGNVRFLAMLAGALPLRPA